MLPIRKNDIVMLADCTDGSVMEIIITEASKVYKIRKQADNQIIYVEDRMVRLRKQCKKNFAVTFLLETVNFILYTLNLGRSIMK